MLLSQIDGIIEIIFASIAAGTFIYISCSEVIIDEFSDKENKVWKLAFYVLGAGIIFSLILVPEE